MNGALFLLDSETALEEVIGQGWYAPRFGQPDDHAGPWKWRKSHRSATADLACLQAGGRVYLFAGATRQIRGIGVLDDPPVVLNGGAALEDGALVDAVAGQDDRYRLVVRFDAQKSRWFEAGVDMDEVLGAGGPSMRSLRTMERVSLIVFDEEEETGFRSEVLVATAGGAVAAPQAAPLGVAFQPQRLAHRLKTRDELALETDICWRLNGGEGVDAFGRWDSALRQVTASPPKPVKYVDRIDVLARRTVESFTSTHGVFELKATKATRMDVEQLMRYVDHVVQTRHQGRYHRVEAFLVAPDFGARIGKARDIARRVFTVDPRRPRAEMWDSLNLVRADGLDDGGYAYTLVEW